MTAAVLISGSRSLPAPWRARRGHACPGPRAPGPRRAGAARV